MQVFLALLLVAGLAAGDLAEDREKYLLPSNVVPVNYNLTIYTNIENFNALNENTFVFSGEVIITVNVTEDNVTEIVLHKYDDMEIILATLTGPDGEITVQVGAYSSETNKQILILSSGLKKGSQYDLLLGYTGRNTNELTGFYRSSYFVLLTRRWLLVTDFEPFGARRAFPCFDEPRYKATFQLTSYFTQALAEDGYSTLFNTDVESEQIIGDYHVTTFKKTPRPISTYLVAFIVSDFAQSPEPAYFQSSYKEENGTKAFNTVGQSKFFNPRQDYVSQVAGPASLNFVTQKTGVGYGFDKVHQAGIPDFAAGAMENWGLVTYRENLVFWNEESGTLGQKQQVVQVTAHELGHQWFGDLVTLHWWTDLWLNEGFATFFETHAADQIREPTLDTSSWDLVGQFVQYVLQETAFFNDGYNDSRPLTAEAYDRETIGNYFDSISYEKGGSVLRMFMHTLGEDLFYAGLSVYLNSQAESIGTPEILLSSFDKAISNLPSNQRPQLPIPAADIFAPWHIEGGYPVVNVTKNNNGLLTFTQERFLYWGDADTLYNIPLTYSTNLENNFNNTLPVAFLLASQPSSTIQLKNASASWIVVNNQATGYFRVNYDQANWDTLLKIINDPATADAIHPYNRAQIIDDANNLGYALDRDYLSYNYILSLFQTLRHDRDLTVWRSALASMNRLLANLASRPQTQTLLKMYFAWIVEPAFNELSLYVKDTDSHTMRLLRADVATMACKLDVSSCRKQAKEIFESGKIHPDVRRVVTCDAVRRGDAEQWSATLNAALAADGSIRSDLFAALTCSSDSSLLYSLLQMTVTDERLSEADVVDIAEAAAKYSAESAELALQAVIKRQWKGAKAFNRVLTQIARNLASEDAEEAVSTVSPFAANVIRHNNNWVRSKNNIIQQYLQVEIY